MSAKPGATAERSLRVHDCWAINGRNLDRSAVVIIAHRRHAEAMPKVLTRIAAAAQLRRRLDEHVAASSRSSFRTAALKLILFAYVRGSWLPSGHS